MRLIINIDDLMTIAHIDDLIDNFAHLLRSVTKFLTMKFPKLLKYSERKVESARMVGAFVRGRHVAAVHMLHDRRGMCALSDRRLIEATRIYCSTSSRFAPDDQSVVPVVIRNTDLRKR